MKKCAQAGMLFTIYNKKLGRHFMKDVLDNLWTEVFKPMFRRPPRIQFAALCHRETKNGRQVLLITSRDTGRWIIPKGWPMAGRSSAETALQEAWEEAGVKAQVLASNPIGKYTYEKGLDNGLSTQVETIVYPIEVGTLADSFPEAAERNRKWVTLDEAANLVDEPELKQIFKDFKVSN